MVSSCGTKCLFCKRVFLFEYPKKLFFSILLKNYRWSWEETGVAVSSQASWWIMWNTPDTSFVTGTRQNQYKFITINVFLHEGITSLIVSFNTSKELPFWHKKTHSDARAKDDPRWFCVGFSFNVNCNEWMKKVLGFLTHHVFSFVLFWNQLFVFLSREEKNPLKFQPQPSM